MEEERWMDVLNFEGYYQVSNLGNVKSLKRIVFRRNNTPMTLGEKILRPGLSSKGYLCVNLSKNSSPRSYPIHHLVWDHFGDRPRTKNDRIDHDDNIKIHNWISNLKLISNRQNLSKGHLLLEKTSRYTGVCWNKKEEKWQVQLWENGTLYYLGRFHNEEVAAQIYQTELAKHIASGGI
jgi:hypothetical protein